MDKEKKLLKISGILKCIMGTLLLHVPVYGLVVLLCGIFLYLQSKRSDEEVYKNRIIYIILSIISIVDIVGSVICFIDYDKINKYKNNINAPPKIRKERENKKIDILLKLGVLLVFISGLLFATTSWNIITDIVKVISLFIFGVLFIIVSIFSSEKLKLYRSSYLYWLLGIGFFLFTIIAVIYFRLFGLELSFYNNTSSIADGVVFLSLTGFLLVTYLKYPKKYLLLASYFTLFFSIYSLLDYYFESITVCFILIILILLINIFNKKENVLRSFANIATYMLIGIFLTNFNASNDLVLIFAGIVNAININYLLLRDDSREYAFINTIITYLILFLSFIDNYILGDNALLLLVLFISLYTVILNSDIIPNKKITKTINYIFYTIIAGIGVMNYFENINSCIVSVIYFVLTIIFSLGLFNIKENKLYKKFQVVAIFYLIISITSLFGFSGYDKFSYGLIFTAIIYCIIHYIFNKKNYESSKLYLLALFIISIISIIDSFNNYEIVFGIVIVFTSLYLFLNIYNEKDGIKNTINIILSYLLILTSIYIPFIYNNLSKLNIYFVCALFIIILLLIMYIFKNKIITNISLLYIAFPLIHVSNNSFDYIWNKIFVASILLYALFLILFLFIKSRLLRNILCIIGVSIILLRLFAINDLYTSIYIGLVGLGLVLFGFKNDKYYPIFIYGIVLIIVNLISSLWSFWSSLPFWLYLLILGLVLIGFVMHKELSNQKKSL